MARIRKRLTTFLTQAWNAQVSFDNLTRQEQAPKARPIPAWGAAPGYVPKNSQGLKARSIKPSIPHIPLIESNSILRQESTEFLLKRNLLMMFRLSIDVFQQSITIRQTHGKRSVAALPGKLCNRLGFQPFRGRALQRFHQAGDIARSRERNCQVDMIGDASNPVALATGVADNRCKVSMKPAPNRFIQKWVSIFRAKHHMNQQKREGLGHGGDYRSGLQPSNAMGLIPGATPQAGMERAFGAISFAGMASSLIMGGIA